MHGGQQVDGPVAPEARSVQLLVEVGQPDAEHPAVAAHEPHQQKPAQQKLGKPAHVTSNFSGVDRIRCEGRQIYMELFVAHKMTQP